MAFLLGRTGNNLTDETGVTLLTDDEFDPPAPGATVFPLFLGLRLRIHAAWATIAVLVGSWGRWG